MNEWLLLLLIPLGGAALGSLFQQDDDDGERGETPSPTEGTEGDDILRAPDGYSGAVNGAAGDDSITGGSPDDPDDYSQRSIARPDDAGWLGASGWNPEDLDNVPEGVVAARGGAGDDTITGDGRGIDIDGGAGDDRIALTSGDAGQDDTNVFAAIARGGTGDDDIAVTGRDAVVLGDAGDDSIAASGSHMRIDGGAGADRIDVAGLTDSSIALGAGDSVAGRGDGDDGLRFLLREGADFTGNASDETLRLLGSARVDGAGGDDRLTLDELAPGSSTLIGGAGDDTIEGAGQDNPGQSSWHADLVGRSDDRLDGGAGDDLILFDRADTVTGGAGADQLIGYVDAGQTATVTDFTAGQDVLRVNLDPDDSTAGADPFGHVLVEERDGATLIRVQGSDVVRLEGATGLSVGFEIGDTYSSDTPQYVDAQGNPVDPATLDVIVNRYERFDT